jgi:hypothetical protein
MDLRVLPMRASGALRRAVCASSSFQQGTCDGHTIKGSVLQVNTQLRVYMHASQYMHDVDADEDC